MSRFLDAVNHRPVDATPVWLMRQAGRSLPEYRRLRERWKLVDIVAQPELCAEVTLQPVRRLGVDAAVMFADIMLPLRGMGVEFELVEDVGPVIARPIESAADVERLRVPAGEEAAPQVITAVRQVVGESPVPVICFCGAPFTLASYLVEGRPSRDFKKVKAFMYNQPEAFESLLAKLAATMSGYLAAQVGAGAAAIHFGTHTASLLELIASAGPDLVSLDWRVPLDVGWTRVGHQRGVQGNLDPAVLLGPSELVIERARDVLRRAAGRPGHVFNLGHGVLPETPLESLQLLIETVHEWRPAPVG